MKRDMDLVREILLAVEAAGEDRPSMQDLFGVPLSEVEIDTRESMRTTSSCSVRQAGWLTGIDAGSMSGSNWLNLELSWPGHDFLDTTRDSEVWKKTKFGVEKIGGAGWEVVKAIAVAYAKEQAKKVLGIELG